MLSSSCFALNPHFCEYAPSLIKQLKKCTDSDACLASCKAIAVDDDMQDIANDFAYPFTGTPLFNACNRFSSLQSPRIYQFIIEDISENLKAHC